jgi:hypothetical protein
VTLEGKVETQVLGGIKSLEDKVVKAATNATELRSVNQDIISYLKKQ